MRVPNALLMIFRISNNHSFATGHPIHFMFGSRVEFSGSADGIVLFPLDKTQDGGHDMTDDIDKS